MAETCYQLSLRKFISDCIGYTFQNIVHPHERLSINKIPPLLILHHCEAILYEN